MAVSRFLKFPILNEFIGKILAHLNPPQRVLDPHGVGGYMRKQAVWVSRPGQCAISRGLLERNSAVWDAAAVMRPPYLDQLALKAYSGFATEALRGC